MREDISIKLKLSQLYRIKKNLIKELNNIRSDLSYTVKHMYSSENLPLSQNFTIFFRDQEYVRLNRFLTEQINSLEKPLSGETEEILEKEIERIEEAIEETTKQLSLTVKYINKFITDISGDEQPVPVEKYIASMKPKIVKNIHSQIEKDIKPEIEKLKGKIKFIYRYEDYSDIMNFLSTYEKEVNIVLSQKLQEKILQIFEKYEKDLKNEISKYIGKYIKSQDSVKRINDEIEKILEEKRPKKFSIHYSLPDIKKHFRQIGINISKIDILLTNFESVRFLSIIISATALFFAGLLIPAPEKIKEALAFLGLALGVYSFIDSLFFNKYYIKKFVKKTRSNIEKDLEKSIDNLISQITEKILKNSIKVEALIISLVNKETRYIREFENFLVGLRNNIEKHILTLSNIKKELDYELSEEQ